jgi:hypothetical protein
MSSKLCEEWRDNPSVNPSTNRYIKKNGPVYHTLEQKCGQPHSHRKPNLDCLEWHGKPTVNPKTFHHIKVGGPVYKKLEKKCGSPSRKSPSRRRRSPSRSPSRRSPVRQRSANVSLNCLEWVGDPLTNPKTNRKIKKGGPVYKKFEKRCGSAE